MDALDSVVNPLREFSKDSIRLVKRCHKPDRKEFTKVAFRTAIGFVVMGFVGFFVKLIFIPINNIIVGSASPPIGNGDDRDRYASGHQLPTTKVSVSSQEEEEETAGFQSCTDDSSRAACSWVEEDST
ncbi:transport protein Sec61 subunit gamma [Nymphaea thermarum]|nr:transport protein Sec61 subunit gamma [Nymphaea thermarum]